MTFLLNIDVPDVERATTFYTAAFGLTVGRRFGNDFVELLGWPAPVYLLTKQAGTMGAGGDRRRYARHWTPVHIDVVVDDVDAAVERALRAGAILEVAASDAPYGRIAMLADPFGHGFCLLAFSAQGTTRCSGRRPSVARQNKKYENNPMHSREHLEIPHFCDTEMM
ncbi:VOC family protein [Bradyrhizobium sp. BR 1432]|uniref:VOC family protein n=1 Tax=Bradyrhizobium sp. BR 1432 TaxID=3447966 RepID=UPI003EE77114